MPQVSVILPVFNAEKYICESIKSILAQTFIDFELIIINDGSTDSSEELIKKFKDDRIIYLENESNLGIIETLNIAIEVSKGLFIARMDADDIAHPQRFEIQVKFLKNNPKYVIVGSFASIIDENSFKKHGTLIVPQNNIEIKTHSFFHSPFVHPSILIRRDVLSKFKYSKDYPLAEDYFLWIKVLEKFNGFNLSDYLIKYRIHNSNSSSNFKKLQNDSLKKIYLYLMSSSFPDLDHSFSNLHMKLCNQNNFIELTEIEYVKIEKYVIELWNKNLVDLVFPTSSFSSLLKTNWLRLTRFAIYRNLKVYCIFSRSEVNKILEINKIDKILIFFIMVSLKFIPYDFLRAIKMKFYIFLYFLRGLIPKKKEEFRNMF